MTLHRVLLTAALLSLAAPAARTLSGQSGAERSVPVGARVRVLMTTPAGTQRLTGTLVNTTPDSLFIEAMPRSAPRAVPLNAVQRLWVSRGRTSRSTLKGLGIGAIVGGLGLGLAAALAETGCRETPGNFGIDCWGAGWAFSAGFVVGGAVGGVVGGLIGYNRNGERWERIP